MHQKLIIFSLIAGLCTFGANAQSVSTLDANTLEFLRIGENNQQPDLMFPPLPEKEKPLPKPTAKKEKAKSVVVSEKKESPKQVLAVENKVEPIVEPDVVEPVIDTISELQDVIEQDVIEEEIVVNTSQTNQSVGEPIPVVNNFDDILEPAVEKVKEDKVSKKIEPLIPVDDEEIKGEIIFDDDSYQLSDEYRDLLTDLVNGFENAIRNKILIVAYNYDNGEGSFKKKRLALNRSTEIRSHLIAQGYKNFSIKIINTDDISMQNIAEVSELKN